MKDFDELLDGVLQEVSNVAPLDGIEHRVMHRVRASRQTAARWRQGLAAAMVLAAGVVVFAVWPRQSVVMRPVRRVTPAQAIRMVPTSPAVGMALAKTVRLGVRPRGSERRKTGGAEQTLPKLAVFPTPVPVTPEVALFMEYTQRHPEEAAALVKTMATAETGIQPIKIEPIRIPEIETASLAPLK